MKNQLIIIGAGLFGRELSTYAREALPNIPLKGFLDSRAHILDGYPGYPPILGSVEDYEIQPGDLFVCGVGRPDSRLAYAQMIEKRGGRFVSVIHPRAYVGQNTVIGDGCVLAPCAVVTNDIVLGRHVLVNANVYVGHDCRVDDGCVFAPLSSPCSLSRFGKRVFMGIGACAIPGLELGDDAFVAAGAVVTANVGPGGRVAGVPARIMKSMT